MVKTGKEKTKKLLKKDAKIVVYDRLLHAFGEYNNGDSKKFDKRLQKATKLFVPFIINGKLTEGAE
ncbi:MAG TPA: hypothetical protein VGP55_11510 [Chitinophagaceae bacterium]|nr:hypothetical protein [Chitinophagaceae bacterium]